METRYISCEECIKDLREYEKTAFSGLTVVGCISRIKRIPSADVVPTPRWIPVKERLPELYQNVLVHYYNLHCVEPHNFAVAYRKSGLVEFIPGVRIWQVDSSPLELNGSDVTHWMPLPQPPKEGGGENE